MFSAVLSSVFSKTGYYQRRAASRVLPAPAGSIRTARCFAYHAGVLLSGRAARLGLEALEAVGLKLTEQGPQPRWSVAGAGATWVL